MRISRQGTRITRQMAKGGQFSTTRRQVLEQSRHNVATISVIRMLVDQDALTSEKQVELFQNPSWQTAFHAQAMLFFRAKKHEVKQSLGVYLGPQTLRTQMIT